MTPSPGRPALQVSRPSPDHAVARERQASWQRRELVIPLELTSRIKPDERRARFDQLVLDALRRAARGGWEPDGPTDWEPLRGAGRFVVRDRRGVFTSLRTWESVTIRLRRRVPA